MKPSDFGPEFRKPDGSYACNCEASYCLHTKEHFPCRLLADDTTGAVMLYLGPVCGLCADTIIAHGGIDFLMQPKGTRGEYVG